MYRLFLILISLAFFSCSDGIVSECETDDTAMQVEATLSDIQAKVFNPTCATSGCHDTQGANIITGLDLSEGKSLEALVNKRGFQSSLSHVTPGDAENSWLIKKIKGEGTSIMPPANAGLPLSQSVIDSIAVWINNGALNN